MESGPDRGATVAGRRRRAVLAGHGADPETAIGLVTDPAPEVRAAALGALARLGALDDALLLRALDDPDGGVRRRAGTLAGRRGCGPDVRTALCRALIDDDDGVAEMAAWALGEHAEDEAEVVSSLMAMARRHRAALCREAAVAALGAIGAPVALPVVVAALDDRPAIRRRAALALAAFDDPVAEAALRRCLEDRDWQVRQAAEELLGPP